MTNTVEKVKGDAFIEIRAHDYGMANTIEKVKEVVNLSVPLQIEKMMGKTMTLILKGVFKKASHNSNARATQKYSVVEYLSQTP